MGIYVSQGSVATQLKCDGMFNNRLIANFPQNVPVKECWKSVTSCRRCGQNMEAYFWPTVRSEFSRGDGMED